MFIVSLRAAETQDHAKRRLLRYGSTATSQPLDPRDPVVRDFIADGWPRHAEQNEHASGVQRKVRSLTRAERQKADAQESGLQPYRAHRDCESVGATQGFHEIATMTEAVVYRIVGPNVMLATPAGTTKRRKGPKR